MPDGLAEMIMPSEDIKKHISRGWKELKLKEYGNQLVNQSDSMAQLWSLTQDGDAKTAWRAAYLMDIINEQYPDRLLSFLNHIKDRLKMEENQSLLRHFSRILCHHNIIIYADGTFIDTCIKHLISKKSAIAVKANFLTLTQQLLAHYPELKQEFKEAFDLMQQDASPAIRCRLRQIIPNQ